jgi:uncharacterized protein YaiI (UPF0178 family)
MTTLVVEHAIRAAAQRGLMTTYLAFQVIVREMQRGMNNEELPTGGLTFDAEHAVALKKYNVVVTHDTWFTNTLKAMTGKVEAYTGGKFRPEVATNAKQLREALRRAS